MLNYLKSFDWKLNAAVFLLVLAGFMSLASADSDLFWKQALWLGIGLVFFIFIFIFDWRPFINYRGAIFGFYLFVVLLLLITYFFAPSIRGTKGWLVFGNFHFQVAELAKLSLIIFYAYFFSRKHIGIARISNLISSFFYFSIPAALIALQPDLGSVLVLFCIWFGFLLVSGINPKHLIVILIILSISGAIMWQYGLKDYQKERIMGFFFPGRDPLGINYNVIQSKIAIGSAGLFGKGFGQGAQVQLGFLPEAKTDFIFAAFIEEWGILAGFLLVAIFLFLVFKIVKIGTEADSNFTRFVCLGAAILFISQFIFNVGSNIGFMPVVGVTFPFLSYGGSSLLTNLVLISIIQSLFARHS